MELVFSIVVGRSKKQPFATDTDTKVAALLGLRNVTFSFCIIHLGKFWISQINEYNLKKKMKLKL